MKAYKGFDKNLQCRGFQYEIGKEYETDRAELCEAGFHACESPLEVWDFYPPTDGNRFCEVEQGGDIKSGEDGKSVSTKLKVGAEIGIPGLVKAHVEWCKEQTKEVLEVPVATDGGRDYAKIGSSGYSAQIGSSGDYAKIGSSGYSAKIGSSGDYAKIGSSGYYAKIGSSGYSAKIGSSGYYAQIGSSGDSAQIGSSGDYAKIGSSGYSAQIGSSGDSAQIRCEGKNAVVACAGADAIVNAPIGTWVCLSEYGEVDGKRVCIGMKAFSIDGKKYKAGVWLALKNGKVVEVKL